MSSAGQPAKPPMMVRYFSCVGVLSPSSVKNTVGFMEGKASVGGDTTCKAQRRGGFQGSGGQPDTGHIRMDLTLLDVANFEKSITSSL
ncbi:hypothetical protein Gotri_020267 [Gossypium trilobum]|uniref:Uncharacterized protein n=2 Tax=Gossypium TaxID=3633 RepID=A0A7J9D9M4_9ROSI|nr:hypothetical protein [Gossypium davidsonii]MBA0757155.1 hypothetical protein [Gossypium trilobum]